MQTKIFHIPAEEPMPAKSQCCWWCHAATTERRIFAEILKGMRKLLFNIASRRLKYQKNRVTIPAGK